MLNSYVLRLNKRQKLCQSLCADKFTADL